MAKAGVYVDAGITVAREQGTLPITIKAQTDVQRYTDTVTLRFSIEGASALANDIRRACAAARRAAS